MDAVSDVLADKAEIVEVTIRYCTALDTRDWALLAECFTDDAEARYQSPGVAGTDGYVGFPAIEKRLGDSMNLLLASQHCVSNHVISLRESEAECRCYVRAQHIRSAATGVESFMVGGTYADRLVRTEVGWRISSRVMTYTWTDEAWSPSGQVLPAEA